MVTHDNAVGKGLWFWEVKKETAKEKIKNLNSDPMFDK